MHRAPGVLFFALATFACENIGLLPAGSKPAPHAELQAAPPAGVAQPAEENGEESYTVQVPLDPSAPVIPPATNQQHSHPLSSIDIPNDPIALCTNAILNPIGYPLPQESMLPNQEAIASWRNHCANEICTAENNYCSPEMLPGGQQYKIHCSRTVVERCFRLWNECETIFRGCMAQCATLLASGLADRYPSCEQNCYRQRGECSESQLGYQPL